MNNYILIETKKNQLKNNIKVAAFDFDFTLVKTKSNKKFPEDENDWEYWDKSVLGKLKFLSEEGYIMVIFSNQNGVGTGKVKESMVINRFNNFIKSTKLDWICMAAKEKDLMRKPNIGMWNFLFKNYKINMKKSFYVGDAAGRVKNYVNKRKKDFSSSDRKFAINLNLNFYTPEEFFLNEEKTDNYILDGFNPLKYKLKPYKKLKIKKKAEKEMIILVGCPGSGKSKFCKKYFSNYVRINQDKLKTKQKCIKLCKESLNNQKSVIIDNTNPDKKARKLYIDLAKANKYTINCYLMNVSKDLGKHMNFYRYKKSGGKKKLVPAIVYNVYFKKLEYPSIDEGFNQINIIEPNFKFKKEKNKNLFMELN